MKYCPNCGTGCAEETKFCQSCGASFAPQPYPQQQPVPPQQPYPQQQIYPQQPYPQPYPMQPPAPPEPPQKKKRTGLKVLLIFLLVVALAAGGVIIAAKAATGKAANADYYKLSGEQVPSVKLALGEKRKVTSTGSSKNGSSTAVENVYQSDTPGRDCFIYASYLVERDGFVCLEDVDFQDPTGKAYFGRNSAQDGYKLLATAEWNAAGYTVTVERSQGFINPVEEEPSTQMHTRAEETQPEETTTKAEQTQAVLSQWDQEVLDLAVECLELLKNRDWGALGAMVHRQQGLTFSPYGYVEDDAVRLGMGDVKALDFDEEVRTWGAFDGSGNPIEYTFEEYYDRFIFDRDFTKAPQAAVDRVIRTTMQNNLYVFGNGGAFVDFHMPGTDPYPDHTWASLRLVFSWEEDVEGLSLVAIVHDEWTV